MKCSHNDTIEVSGLVYCKKCNKYIKNLNKKNILDNYWKPFIDSINERFDNVGKR